MNKSGVLFITGNDNKAKEAKDICLQNGVVIYHESLVLTEIQSDDISEIAVEKAKQAYSLVKIPLIINDSSWIIPSMGGFPGPYMKHMNKWLKAEDFIKLMDGKDDRAIILRETVVYIDDKGTQIISKDIFGQVLKEVKGLMGAPSDKVITLLMSGESISERLGRRQPVMDLNDNVCIKFCEWYKRR